MSDGIVELGPDIDSPLARVRWQLAESLADSPWPVHVSAVDAVAGPCLVIMSGSREPLPAFACNYMSHPSVILVAGRVEPGSASDLLDAQEDFVLSHRPFPYDRTDDESQMSFGGVPYLTRRIVFHTTVTMGEQTPAVRTFGRND